MKWITFIFFLGYAWTLQAQEVQKPERPYRKSDFIAYAAGDDTLIALVNMVYRKRGEAGRFYAVGAGTLIVAPLVGALFAVSEGIQGNDDPSQIIQGAMVVAGTVFYGATIVGTIRLIRYSRARLLRVLEAARAGAPWPEQWVRQLRASDFSSS